MQETMPEYKKPLFGRRAPAFAADPSDNSRSGDNRKNPRATTFKNASIRFADRTKTDCIARNICPEGCMIAVRGAENLPLKLKIRLGPLGREIEGKIVWRQDDTAGLQFI